MEHEVNELDIFEWINDKFDHLDSTIRRLERLIIFSVRNERQEMSALDDDITALQQAVAQNTSVEQSAITLINGIPQMISDAVAKAQAAGATPAELQSLTDLGAALQTQATSLGQAVLANTPAAAPAPAPAPTPSA